MAYHYSDPKRESNPHALPDVEVFESSGHYSEHAEEWHFEACSGGGGCSQYEQKRGYFWAASFPGCLWDSDPVGPFDSEAEALADAREGVEI